MSSEQIITEGFGLGSVDFILTMGLGDGVPPAPVVSARISDIVSLDYIGDLRMILEDGEGGVSVFQNDLERDAGLETAVLLSLFTDQRVSKGEELPDDSGDRRGWWGDLTGTDQIGSKLWLLGRAKMTAGTYERVKTYGEEALKWMIDDGVVDSVAIIVVKGEQEEELTLTVSVVRPENGDSISFRYFYNWKAQTFRRG